MERAATHVPENLAVSMWPLARLQPYASNARKHSAEQIDAIAASLKRFGWRLPLLIAADGTIIAGHGRLAAAQKLGFSEAPVMVASDMTDDERRAYTMLDNRLAEMATWDEDLLRLELGELRDHEFELGVIGFSEVDLSNLFKLPDFVPGTADEQSKLDELSPKIIECPACHHQFDARTAEAKS